MELNFVSVRDRDVAAESEEDKQMKDEGERSRGKHEEVLCGPALCRPCRCDPAPVISDSVICVSFCYDEFPDAHIQYEDAPCDEKGYVGRSIWPLTAEEEQAEGVCGDY